MFEALRPRAHACARVRCARAIPVQHAPGRELKLRVRWQLPFPGHASGFRFSGEGIGFSHSRGVLRPHIHRETAQGLHGAGALATVELAPQLRECFNCDLTG